MTPTIWKLRWIFGYVSSYGLKRINFKISVCSPHCEFKSTMPQLQSVLKKLCRRELSNFDDNGLKLQLLSLSVVMLHSTAGSLGMCHSSRCQPNIQVCHYTWQALPGLGLHHCRQQTLQWEGLGTRLPSPHITTKIPYTSRQEFT